MSAENAFWNTTNVVAFSSAIAGAFFGSLSAFWLGRLQQKRDLRDRKHSALLATQYALLSQWNILENVRRQHLEPLRQDSTRFTKLSRFYTIKAHCSVPFSEITFIANSDEPNLLQEMHIAEQSYLNAILAIELYNQKRDEFFKNAEGRVDQFDMETGKTTIATAPQEVFMMRSVTDILYESVDKALPKLDEEVGKIWEFVKRNFKGMKAIKCEPKPEHKTSAIASK
jgi:hypothetical protein